MTRADDVLREGRGSVVQAGRFGGRGAAVKVAIGGVGDSSNEAAEAAAYLRHEADIYRAVAPLQGGLPFHLPNIKFIRRRICVMRYRAMRPLQIGSFFHHSTLSWRPRMCGTRPAC